MPWFEVHLFRAAAPQPFASLPISPTSYGSFIAGQNIFIVPGPDLSIGKVSHRCLPGPNGEPLIQTALMVSEPAHLVEPVLSAPWVEAGGDFVPWPWLATATPPADEPGTVFEGVGLTLEEAAASAHARVPIRPHRDFAVSKVVGWGLQRGGITDQTRFYVQVVEDPEAPFRRDAPLPPRSELTGSHGISHG